MKGKFFIILVTALVLFGSAQARAALVTLFSSPQDTSSVVSFNQIGDSPLNQDEFGTTFELPYDSTVSAFEFVVAVSKLQLRPPDIFDLRIYEFFPAVGPGALLHETRGFTGSPANLGEPALSPVPPDPSGVNMWLLTATLDTPVSLMGSTPYLVTYIRDSGYPDEAYGLSFNTNLFPYTGSEAVSVSASGGVDFSGPAYLNVLGSPTNVSPMPSPVTLPLISLGLMGLIWLRRRSDRESAR